MIDEDLTNFVTVVNSATIIVALTAGVAAMTAFVTSQATTAVGGRNLGYHHSSCSLCRSGDCEQIIARWWCSDRCFSGKHPLPDIGAGVNPRDYKSLESTQAPEAGKPNMII